jgi:hypothetical protein
VVSRHRRAAILAAACVVLVVLLIPTAVASWAPILHWSCDTVGPATENYNTWIPFLLLNSPYEGNAWVNSTTPYGFIPPEFGEGIGTQFYDGGADWAGYEASINFTPIESQLMWGPGPNSRCGEPFRLSVQYIGPGGGGIPIIGPGNRSDEAEPNILNQYPAPGGNNVSTNFWNGFEVANSPSVSTCGLPGISKRMTSPQFAVTAPLVESGIAYAIPYILPAIEQYHYWFPADSGTWQIDNLSAPGGPGGGWAFSYSPCP